MCATMLISREKNRFKIVDETKVSLGQFQTKGPSWMAPQVVTFITDRKPKYLYDPFAGMGSLLESARQLVGAEIRGLDIDASTGWPHCDSLQHIPPIPNSLIITNPPYLAMHSAKRKGVHEAVADRYHRRSDLYQLALDRCLEACEYVVAIVPETIINSDYPKSNFESITILEENPFTDKDCPVCVVCIDRNAHPDNAGPTMYIGARKIGSLDDLIRKRLHPRNTLRIDFNVPQGRIALRAVDLPNPQKPIAFMRREKCDYPTNRIKVSSRLVTFLEIPALPDNRIDSVIAESNRLLAYLRESTSDLVLSPFKGNVKTGRRRRRLDYYTARAILERAAEIRHAELPLFQVSA